MRCTEILKGGRETATADAAQVNEGSRLPSPLYDYVIVVAETHKILVMYGPNTLLERILADLNFAAGIAVAHLAPHTAYQAAHADKVAPPRRDQFIIFI